MKIVSVGAGYVGLVSGVCFSEIGHDVVCVDSDVERIATLRSGQSPIYEPGLEELMTKNVAAKRLSFSEDLAHSVRGADAVFICVGTPQDDRGSADLSYVYEVSRELAKCIEPDTVVVIKSTVPVGTNAKVRAIISGARRGIAFSVASNPEFLREGSAIGDFMKPDRIVAGVKGPRSREVMEEIYYPLTREGRELLITDPKSAEVIKYASNAFLAAKIAFINEIARLCEHAGGDIEAVSRGMGLDTRIGNKFLRAGPGFGGSCFPKDTMALIKTSHDMGLRLDIAEAVMTSNTARKTEMIDIIAGAMNGNLDGAIIAVFGVTFKPGTDDMRDAPSTYILPELQRRGASLRIVDPQGKKEGEIEFPGSEWCDTAHDAAKGADAIVVLTEWPVFSNVDLKSAAAHMRTPRLIDLRNIYSVDRAKSAGFDRYVSVGRPGY